MLNNKFNSLTEFVKQVRRDIIEMVYVAKSGHPGGSLSCVEIISVLYNKVMDISPDWKNSAEFEKRDRFILSKGHASPCLYAVLANCGFFPHEELLTFRKLGSRLQGHPSSKTKLEGIEASTGSLGQGLSMAAGLALALRLDKNPAKVFALMGDGEMQEGSVWEALMNIKHQKLENIIVIIDKNRLQIDGETSCVKCCEPLDKKLEAFGFMVNCIDGHDVVELEKALLTAKNANKPYAIIANTVKGKGVSYMENNPAWHGNVPNVEKYNVAMEELNA